MKKTLITILLGAFGAMAIAVPAFAATSVSFTPANVSVRQGQTFTFTIGINSQGAKNYTTKTELHYPADLLEVKSFTFANGWTALSQSGYDLTDNTNGVLIKTAGYPGGVSSPVTFGTVSFLAKKSGNGTISLNSNSFALDANNQNVLVSASVQTAVAISAPTPTTPTTQTTPAVELTEEAPVGQEPTTASQPIAQQSLLAAVGSAVTFGTGNALIGVLFFLVLLLAGYGIYTVVQKVRRKNLGKLR